MTRMQTEIPTSKTCRILPIAALLFSLIGLLELGWVWVENIKARTCGGPYTENYFSIPSLLGFTLSLIAIRKNHHGAPILLAEGIQAPIWTGGKLLAILGAVAGSPGLFLALASLPSCSIYSAPTGCRESGPMQTLRIIHNSQAQYYATCFHFGTLEELHATGYIEAALTDGSVTNGYVYSSSDITAETYCAHADRANDKCGSRDFIICEDGIIRYSESKVRGTVKRDEGTPLCEARGAGSGGQFQK